MKLIPWGLGFLVAAVFSFLGSGGYLGANLVETSKLLLWVFGALTLICFGAVFVPRRR